MSLVIVGSLAFDTLETPFGRKERIVGGSCTYCALAASFFTQPGIVSVIGEDFPEETIDFFTTLSKQYPQYAKGYMWIAMAHMLGGRPEDSIRWYRRAINRDPGLQLAHYNMGRALVELNRLDEALEAWEKTIKIAPNSITGRKARVIHDRIRKAMEGKEKGIPTVIEVD